MELKIFNHFSFSFDNVEGGTGQTPSIQKVFSKLTLLFFTMLGFLSFPTYQLVNAYLHAVGYLVSFNLPRSLSHGANPNYTSVVFMLKIVVIHYSGGVTVSQPLAGGFTGSP